MGDAGRPTLSERESPSAISERGTIMTDRSDKQNNQQQVDNHANLFYLLERLSRPVGSNDGKPGEEPSISHEQIQTFQRQNGIVS
jgi:hypothetical protein